MSEDVRNGMALGIYGTFLVVAFGWRTWLQWRWTGDTGLRTHATFGSVQWWGKVGFIAAICAGLAAPIAGLAGWAPIPLLDSPALQLGGLALAAVGVAGTTWSQWAMGNSWRIGVDPDERTALIADGIFGAVRNPIFTFMLMTATGLAGLVGNVIAIGGLMILIVTLEVQVRLVEEPYLLRTHGADYVGYAHRTGRFVPRIGRLDGDSNRADPGL